MTLRAGRFRRGDGESGAAVIEFALLLPILVVLVLGIADFGRAYNAQVSLSAAAREGVRVLALDTGDDPVLTTRNAAPSLTAGQIAVATTGCPAAGGGQAQVTATYPFQFITPLPTFVPGVPNNLTLTGIGVMRCGG